MATVAALPSGPLVCAVTWWVSRSSGRPVTGRSPYLASPPCSRHRPGSVCVVVAAAAKQQMTVKPAAAEAVLRSAAAARRFACASLPLSSFFFARASLLCCRALATLLQLTELPHTGGVLAHSNHPWKHWRHWKHADGTSRSQPESDAKYCFSPYSQVRNTSKATIH